MKKFDLVHTTILIVAILTGYLSLQSLVSALSMFAYSVSPSDTLYQVNYLSVITNNLLLCIAYAIAAFVLVRNSRKYADAILSDAADEDVHTLGLDRQNIIFALILGLGIYQLIQSVPQFLSDAYLYFTRKLDPTSTPQTITTRDLALRLFRILIGAFLVYASPSLTRAIEKNIAPRLNPPSSNPQTQQSTPQDV